MRIYLILIKCLLVINYSYSQGNLVQDPSFEAYHWCAWNIGNFPMKYWYSYSHNILVTSFNCGNYSTSCGVPKNLYGYQQPASGNGYIGLRTFGGAGDGSRDFVISKLKTTLIIGQKYYVTFKVNVVDDYGPWKCRSNKHGVLFTKDSLGIAAPFLVFPNFAHIYSNSIITDTINWTTVSGSFIADSTYSYISLGNFYNNTLTNWISTAPGAHPSYQSGYTYYDDICVSTDSLYCEKWTGINDEEALNKIQIFPNPVQDRFRINTTKHIEDVKLFSLNGIPVDISSINTNEYTMLYVNDGIYILQLRIEGKVLYKKIVVYNNSY